MTSIVSKPDHGALIGTAVKDSVFISEQMQTYFDDITEKLNINLLGEAVILPSYTVLTVPNALKNSNGVIIVSNEVGGRTLASSDGIDWRRVSDGTVIS